MIEDKIYTIDSKEDLDKIIEKLNSFNGEIWIEYTEELKICLLLNTTRIYLMYLNEDSCFVAIDKNIDNFSFMAEFILSNGQLDEYSLYQTLPREKLNDIIHTFYNSLNEFMDNFDWIEE